MARTSHGSDELWDPIAEFDRLQQEFDRVFGLNPEHFSPGLFDRTGSPALDVVETENEFIVTGDFPGMAQNDIDLFITNNILTMKGVKHSPAIDAKARLIRDETWSGEFQRTVSFNESVSVEGVSAKLADGRLTVIVPKTEEARPKQITVNVK